MSQDFHGTRHTQTAAHCCSECGQAFDTTLGGVRFNDRHVEYNGHQIRCTHSEGEMLRLLARRFGKTVHRDSLYTHLYNNDDSDVNEKIIQVFICKLRKKLAGTGLEIKTAWGMGWSLHACAVGN